MDLTWAYNFESLPIEVYDSYFTHPFIKFHTHDFLNFSIVKFNDPQIPPLTTYFYEKDNIFLLKNDYLKFFEENINKLTLMYGKNDEGCFVSYFFQYQPYDILQYYDRSEIKLLDGDYTLFKRKTSKNQITEDTFIKNFGEHITFNLMSTMIDKLTNLKFGLGDFVSSPHREFMNNLALFHEINIYNGKPELLTHTLECKHPHKNSIYSLETHVYPSSSPVKSVKQKTGDYLKLVQENEN
jgi:hypothetical protein